MIKSNADSLLLRRLERKKELNSLVYVLPTNYDDATDCNNDGDKTANTDSVKKTETEEEKSVQLLLDRFKAHAAIFDETRGEVTVAVRHAWQKFNNKKREEEIGDDEVRDGPEEEDQTHSQGVFIKRQWLPPTNAQDLKFAKFLACADPTFSARVTHARRSSDVSEMSAFTETGASLFACEPDPASFQLAVSTFLTKIDCVERSVFRVVSPREAERLEKLERKIAALGTFESDEEDSDEDVCYSFSLTKTFDSINGASTKEADNMCQDRDTGDFSIDQRSILPAKSSTNDTEIVELYTPNGLFAIECKRSDLPSRTHNQQQQQQKEEDEEEQNLSPAVESNTNGTQIVQFYTSNGGFAIECKFAEPPTSSSTRNQEKNEVVEKAKKYELLEEGQADIINMPSSEKGRISDTERERHPNALVSLSMLKLRIKLGKKNKTKIHCMYDNR